MILGLLSMVALGAEVETEAADAVEVTEERAPQVVSVFIGGGLEPTSRPNPDSVVARAGVQWRFSRHVAAELGGGAFVPLGQPTIVYRDLTDDVSSVDAYLMRPGTPVATVDLRVQVIILDGALTSARRDVPFTLSVDLGGGAVVTGQPFTAVQCPPSVNCVASQEKDVVGAPLIGSSLSLAPTERLQVRGVVQYRTWLQQNPLVDDRVRVGSTTLTLEIGAVLGRVESQKKRSRYEAPLKPADPLYLQGL